MAVNSDALTPGTRTAFATLRQFVRQKPEIERCGLCAATLPEIHPHLVDLETRALLCGCEACAILFSGGGNTRYKRVPRDIRRLTDMRMAGETWDSLSIPINVAFLFYNSRSGKPVIVYPSAAGATESALPIPAWDELAVSTPALRRMENDVEALLVNRLSPVTPPEYYIVPVDECYKLVGLIRTHWRGLAGGTRVWQEVDLFFAAIRQRARDLRLEAPHA